MNGHTDWRRLRDQVQLNEDQVAAHRARLDDEVYAYNRMLDENVALKQSLLDMAYLALGTRQMPDGRQILVETASDEESDAEYLAELRERLAPIEAILLRHRGTLNLETEVISSAEYEGLVS